MKTFNVTPKASVLIESLRDIGYSLETALSDIIDNSITAGAKNIKIFSNTENSNPKLGIIDDGCGMNQDELMNAMRPGSYNPTHARTASDLGRFGLGLKTASFSQCRKLTVVTRKEGTTNAATWDLDYVAKQDNWLVKIPEVLTDIPWVDSLGKQGTLVLWEDMDRLTGKGDSANNNSHFCRQMDEACNHIELCFHRFLSGEGDIKKTHIFVNNRPLMPFDPFHSKHTATIKGPKEIIRLGNHEVNIQVFTLPHHSKVSKTEWELYAGRAGYSKNQGFYVYRGKRLIIYGTWFGLARQSELTKLTRVRIDLQNEFDFDWKIDVKKSSAQLPYPIRDRLRRIIEEIGSNSKRIYHSRGKKLTDESCFPVWNRVMNRDEIIYRINNEHPVIQNFVSNLSDNLKADFFRILEFTGASLPFDALCADLGGNPEKVKSSLSSEETLQHAVIETVKSLKEIGYMSQDIADILKISEPFRSNWEMTKIILDKTYKGEII